MLKLSFPLSFLPLHSDQRVPLKQYERIRRGELYCCVIDQEMGMENLLLTV